jgi:hypothetical protein
MPIITIADRLKHYERTQVSRPPCQGIDSGGHPIEKEHCGLFFDPTDGFLGDAEQIIVMKAMNDRGEIVARGSIDNHGTRDLACAILEGAREAFLRRAKIYGVRLRQDI